MNSKYLDLANQANIIFDGNVCHCYKPELKKFAELIIQECTNAALDNGCGDFVDIKSILAKHFEK